MKLAPLALLAGLAVNAWNDTASAQYYYYEEHRPRYRQSYDYGPPREYRGGGSWLDRCRATRSDWWTCGNGPGGPRSGRRQRDYYEDDVY